MGADRPRRRLTYGNKSGLPAQAANRSAGAHFAARDRRAASRYLLKQPSVSRSAAGLQCFDQLRKHLVHVADDAE
ncbi:MAG TPA: hypothetical protein VHN36_02610, partial [Ilumatobacteraceae bacterium]|nr:hypothetical protein [Ilumatobacteraceae bacterium]